MRLASGATVGVRAPERGEAWAADLSIIAAEGERPSAACYLTATECLRLGRWLLDMAGNDAPVLMLEHTCRLCNGLGSIPGFLLGTSKTCTSCHGKGVQ